MSSDWHKATLLSECASFQEGYVNPSQLDVSYFGNDVKWLRATDLNDGFVFETSRRLSKKGFESAGKSATLFEPGSLAISKSGTIGRIGILKDYMCGNRAVINIKPNASCDYRFIFYTLLLNRQRIETLAEGSVQKNLYVSALGSLRIELPSIKEQIKISSVLGALDDRIALLRETNATLEAIAQAMFKSWFVDFDPVHAKQQGRAPEGMDEATTALFPDSFEESELGLVPKGWGIRKAETLLTRLSTKIRYTKEQVSTSGTIPVYEQGAKILLGYHENAAQFAATPNEPMFIFGDHTCVFHLSCEPFDISMNVIPLKGSDMPTLWTYYAVKDKQTFQEYRRHWMELAVKDVVVAPQEICNQFSLIAAALHVKMESNSWQANTLATLRDTLLPRLISGQLRLPEAEAPLEEAAA